MVDVLDDGIEYELVQSRRLSPDNGGYEGVTKQGNKFNAKIAIEKGKPQTMLPGGGCATAKEARCSPDRQVQGQPV